LLKVARRSSQFIDQIFGHFMRRLHAFVTLLFAVVLLLCAGAMSQVLAADTIGVVLMHGKAGTASSGGPLGPLVRKLKKAGMIVVAPDMPWSRSRYLAKDYAGSMAEIDVAVDRLKRQGATRIVVAGHSMGANAALGYAARRDDIAGVVAIAPGHDPANYGFQKNVNHDYRRAKTMVDKGQGDAYERFADTNQGKRSTVRVKAEIYLDWFDPSGPAAMRANTEKLKPGTALLCVYGKGDRLRIFGRPAAFDAAPPNPKNVYLEVSSGHMQTPGIAADRIVEWIKAL
jgi:pimeloyl-ACP methyl ester carboxylesterase